MLIGRVFMVCDRLIIKARALTIAAVAVGLLAPMSVQAFDVGRSRVVSAPGQPLVVDVALINVTAQDAQSLNVSIAPAKAWQAAGLTPPVALEQLQVSVQTGISDSTRVARVSSPSTSDQTVINVLLDVATDTGRRAIQSSVIVAPAPAVRLASDQSVTVMRGDTLIGIANRFPVAGASVYQSLWALFQANPNAFISQNMNLLKAGAALNIPDAATVLAIDSAFARAQYLTQVQAFQRMRGATVTTSANAVDAAGAPSTSAQDRGQVESAQASVAPDTEDQVRLSATPLDVAADQQTSEARALAEEQARAQLLDKNADTLAGAAAVSGSTGQNEADGRSSGTATGQSVTDAAAAATKETASAPDVASGNQPIDAPIGTLIDAPTDNQTEAAPTASSTDTVGVTASDAPIDSKSDTTTTETTAAAATDGSTPGQTAQTDALATTATTTDAPATAGGDAPIDAATDAAANQMASAAQTDGATGTDSVASATSAASSGLATGSVGSDAAYPAQDAVSQAMAWVSNNVAAAIAIVLAMFALILAWALRATARQEKAQALAAGTAGLNDTQQAFQDKLESIDLSFDEASAAGELPDATQTEKPPAGKPDGTA